MGNGIKSGDPLPVKLEDYHFDWQVVKDTVTSELKHKIICVQAENCFKWYKIKGNDEKENTHPAIFMMPSSVVQWLMEKPGTPMGYLLVAPPEVG